MAVLGGCDGGGFGWGTICRYLPFPAGLRLVARVVSVFHQGGLAGVCHLPFQRLRNGCDTRECEGVASLVVRWRVFEWLRVWLRGRPCVPMLLRCHMPEARKLAESNPPRCGSRCLSSSVLVIFLFGSLLVGLLAPHSGACRLRVRRDTCASYVAQQAVFGSPQKVRYRHGAVLHSILGRRMLQA